MCLPFCLFDWRIWKKKDKGVLVYEPRAGGVVKLTGLKKKKGKKNHYHVPQPFFVPPPTAQPQPQYYQPPTGPPFVSYASTMPAQPYGPQPAYTYPQQNPYAHLGQTGFETFQNHMAHADDSDINAKQEMKPADDDPGRFYWVREQDNTWTQRNRFTIDSGDIGDCRWYCADGRFYAVRLG